MVKLARRFPKTVAFGLSGASAFIMRRRRSMDKSCRKTFG